MPLDTGEGRACIPQDGNRKVLQRGRLGKRMTRVRIPRVSRWLQTFWDLFWQMCELNAVWRKWRSISDRFFWQKSQSDNFLRLHLTQGSHFWKFVCAWPPLIERKFCRKKNLAEAHSGLYYEHPTIVIYNSSVVTCIKMTCLGCKGCKLLSWRV